ncbi:hypothetical protein PACTADRAFT_50854 [Pachysolen tannophilus NRRL Y-2460]|uniref:Uncharacterized protein n=1 Tax=Pachysolen tannophilus NRRL Y-2460 TaxID=669874 RepID=A0A1E4TTG0_PACTA|nr:hypothetical protein PACTADRAFT_50854 [Pachysolen tannophilus NRRL Y-2460]
MSDKQNIASNVESKTKNSEKSLVDEAKGFLQKNVNPDDLASKTNSETAKNAIHKAADSLGLGGKK